MFLGQMEAKQKVFRQRIQEIRGLLSGAPVPGPSDPGVTNGLRIPYDIRDRLIEIQSRHGLRSTKEALYKSMLLGLVTLERLEPANGERRVPNGLAKGHRVLDPDEVRSVQEGGFGVAR
jgi:hypothetical protein